MTQVRKLLYGAIGVITFAAGGRVLHTEIARSDMIDFNQQVESIFKNERLKAQWAEKIARVDRKYQEQERKLRNCDFNEVERREYEERVTKSESLPRGVQVNAETHCFLRKMKSQDDAALQKSLEIESMGSYEHWAIMQSGIEKSHRWLKYPQDLRERIGKGERGLLLGKFWKYLQ